MKPFFLICVIALMAASSVSGQWRKGGELTEDSADRKSVNGFAGHLIVVENPKGFIEEWKKPEVPNITLAKDVKRGEIYGALILFAGCKPDAQGVCNSEVDYTINKPDGSLYGESKQQPLWKEAPLPATNIQLSTAILGFRIEPKDPAGEYKVKARVSDLNAHISFELETSFRVK